MAEANSKVMDMVQSELKKNPDISNAELLQKARAIDKGVDKLSARQFNATYPLQVKRSMAPPRKRKRGKTAGKAVGKAAKGKRGPGRPRKAGGRRAGAGATSPRASSQPAGNRDQVRKVLVQLARDVAEGDRGALVEVVAGIDRYVDRVLKATG